MPEKYVICSSPDFGEGWRWFGATLTSEDVRWIFIDDKKSRSWRKILPKPNLGTIYCGLQTALAARKYKPALIVSHDARFTFWSGLFCRLLGIRSEHVAWSFNFPELPARWYRWIMALGYKRVDHFVVHSTAEMEIYHRAFSIPKDRFDLKLWAIDPPQQEEIDSQPFHAGDYVSAIGGNARDYATLLAASRFLPEIPMVLVVRPENLKGLDVPPHVTVYVDQPIQTAMNILRHSRFTVVPLRDSEVPCGHVTMVAAMFFGQALIVTDSSGVRDYVFPEENGLVYKSGDAHDLAECIRRLWNDKERIKQLGSGGLTFARKNLNLTKHHEYFEFFLRERGLARNTQDSSIPVMEKIAQH